MVYGLRGGLVLCIFRGREAACTAKRTCGVPSYFYACDTRVGTRYLDKRTDKKYTTIVLLLLAYDESINSMMCSGAFVSSEAYPTHVMQDGYMPLRIVPITYSCSSSSKASTPESYKQLIILCTSIHVPEAHGPPIPTHTIPSQPVLPVCRLPFQIFQLPVLLDMHKSQDQCQHDYQ